MDRLFSAGTPDGHDGPLIAWFTATVEFSNAVKHTRPSGTVRETA